MINEKLEAVNYLQGKNIQKQNLYRMCYMIAKHLRDSGLQAFEARKQIFEWANDNNLFIKFNLNDILNIVYLRDRDPLVSDRTVCISDEDIAQITQRFDYKKTKMAALAMLCYAKAFANKNGEFQCSGTAIASWIGISKSAFFRYLQELNLMGFVKQIDTTHDHLHRWQDRPLMGINGNTYKILYDWKKDGNHMLIDNDLSKLYDECNL